MECGELLVAVSGRQCLWLIELLENCFQVAGRVEFAFHYVLAVLQVLEKVVATFEDFGAVATGRSPGLLIALGLTLVFNHRLAIANLDAPLAAGGVFEGGVTLVASQTSIYHDVVSRG